MLQFRNTVTSSTTDLRRMTTAQTPISCSCGYPNYVTMTAKSILVKSTNEGKTEGRQKRPSVTRFDRDTDPWHPRVGKKRALKRYPALLALVNTRCSPSSTYSLNCALTCAIQSSRVSNPYSNVANCKKNHLSLGSV